MVTYRYYKSISYVLYVIYVYVFIYVYIETHTYINNNNNKVSALYLLRRLYSEGRMSAWYLSFVQMVAAQDEQSCARRLPSTSNCSVFFL